MTTNSNAEREQTALAGRPPKDGYPPSPGLTVTDRLRRDHQPVVRRGPGHGSDSPAPQQPVAPGAPRTHDAGLGPASVRVISGTVVRGADEVFLPGDVLMNMPQAEANELVRVGACAWHPADEDDG